MLSEERAKGFAGLESLVSEVEIPVPSPRPINTQQIYPKKEATRDPDVYQCGTSSEGRSGKWFVIAVGIIIFFIWKNDSENKNTSIVNPNKALDYNYSYNKDTTYESPSHSPNQAEIPPVGTDILLTRNQIRYCLSEEIRIDSWQNEVNEYSESSVDAFNLAVGDCNSRCSSFRYRRESLESIRSEVEANRESLAAEGRNKALLNP